MALARSDWRNEIKLSHKIYDAYKSIDHGITKYKIMVVK